MSIGSDWRRAIATCEARFGAITVLVNNAGIIGAVAACADLDEDEFARVCMISQTGVFLGMKYAIPSMIKAGIGSIISISSISGIVAIYGTPNVAYAASKFAVRGLTKQAAIEYGGNNIRVNSVHPGYIRTAMMTEALTPDQIVVASGSVPIKRVGEAEDVSNLVIYLASDELGFTTGTKHVIDGGLTARYFGIIDYARIYGRLYVFVAATAGVAPMIFGYIYEWTGSYALPLQVSSGLLLLGGLGLLTLGRYPQKLANPD